MVGINLDQTLSRKGRPSVSLKDRTESRLADLGPFNWPHASSWVSFASVGPIPEQLARTGSGEMARVACTLRGKRLEGGVLYSRKHGGHHGESNVYQLGQRLDCANRATLSRFPGRRGCPPYSLRGRLLTHGGRRKVCSASYGRGRGPARRPGEALR